MTQLARIRATLNATALPCYRTAAEPALPTLGEALNRTILPRWLDLHLSNGVNLHLLVRNRRLYRLDIDGRDSGLRTALAPEHNDAVASLLNKVCTDAEVTTLNARPPDGEDDFAGLGIAADALSAGLNSVSVDPSQAPDLQERITTFAAQHPTQVEAAFAMADNEIAALAGSQDSVEHLLPEVSDILSRLSDDRFAMGAALETDGLLVLPRSAGAQGCHLIAGELGLFGVVVLRDTSPTEALTRWREQHGN